MYSILFTEGPEGDPSQMGTWEQGYHMYNKCMKHVIYDILFTEGPEGDPLKRGLGNRAIYHMYNKCMKHMSCIIGASLSEPHSSELTAFLSVLLWYVRRAEYTSFLI